MKRKNQISALACGIATLLPASETAQAQSLFQWDREKNTTEVVIPHEKQDTLAIQNQKQIEYVLDSLDYQKILKTPIWILEKRYGKENTIHIVQHSTLKYLNQLREIHNLPPLHLDEHLTKAAQMYAEEMKKNKRFSHKGKNWKQPRERIEKAGYKGKYTAENIAKDYSYLKVVLEAWENSPWHYRNILNPRYNALGVGFCEGYWVNCFWGI